MAGTKAIIYMNQATANADLDWQYKEEGLDGNAVGVEYLDPAANSSPLAITYANGKVSVSLATDGAGVLTTTADELKLAIHGTKASNTLTSDTTEVVVADTVTIGGIVYTFRTTMASAYDVKRNGTYTTTLGNLVKAINGTGTPGTEYYAGTLANPVVSAVAAGATVVVTARVAGTAQNSVPTTEAGIHTSWAETTLGGAGATSVGVAPTISRQIDNLFDITDTSGHDGTGIIAALAVKHASSAGGTAGVNITYDSAAEAMAAGFMLGNGTDGAEVVQNDQSKTTAGSTTITTYRAYVYNGDTGGLVTLGAADAASLLAACKTYAITQARNGKARNWNPSVYLSPALYHNDAVNV